MKIIIAGSRGIADFSIVLEAIEKSGFDISEVVSGGAAGVDRLGERFSKTDGLPLKVFPADWDKYGKSAGYIRNEQMADYADGLIAVWDGVSRGTKHMIDSALKRKMPVYIHNIGKHETTK